MDGVQLLFTFYHKHFCFHIFDFIRIWPEKLDFWWVVLVKKLSNLELALEITKKIYNNMTIKSKLLVKVSRAKPSV